MIFMTTQTWSEFKTVVASKSLRPQYSEDSTTYDIYAVDSAFCWRFSLIKGSADSDDFEANHKSTYNAQISPPTDSDNSPIQRPKTTKTGWHFEPRSIDFITSKYGTMYNRKHNGNGIDDGTDYGDAVMKFFDGSGNELSFQQTGYETETEAEFQTRLDGGCVRTQIDWQATYDMDVIGGLMRIKNVPVDRAYFWAIVAPDIPEASGGSVPFIAGGRALHMLGENDKVTCDGRGIKTFLYDPVYNSNKFRIVVKHGVGVKINLEVVFEHYRG